MNNITRLKSGFTLIELLVVISIVSLLSSVVLASLNSAREKGRIAAGQQFAAALHHGLGSETMAALSFEEGGTLGASDLTGNGNNVTITGASWVTDTYHSTQKWSLSFNGTSQYVRANGTESLNIRTAGTVSLWVKPTVLDGALRNVIIKGGGAWVNNDYSIFFYNNRFYGNVADGTIGLNYAGPKTPVVDNRWYHIAFSWDTTKSTARMYLNGVLTESVNLGFIPRNRIYELRVGASDSGYYFGGIIDDIKIYATSLSLTKIENLYADGVPKHFAHKP